MSTAEQIYADARTANDNSKPPSWASRATIVPNDWYTTPPKCREWLLRDVRTEANEGVFPLGKVGLLAAEGGAGKTMAVVQLAVAVATGTRWLGTLQVPNAGKVLMILGEEDAEEVHRRIYRATQQDGAVVPPNGFIVTLPLAGVTCPMVDDGDDGAFLVWLHQYVEETGPYALIIVDPISRFYGADAERDNAAGTRFCQALESLVVPSGGAGVIACHHVNKSSRGSSATVDASSARGSSAFTDGVRWVATIGVETIDDGNTVLKLTVPKTNYAKKPPPLELTYADGGVLVPLDDASREQTERARQEADPRTRRKEKAKAEKSALDSAVDDLVVAAVQSNPGIDATHLRKLVKAMAKCGSDGADVAVERVVLAQRIRRTSGKPKKHYVVDRPDEQRPETTPAPANGVGVHVDQYPPV